jgi:cytochrome c-type biogenesis protein CcmH
MKFAMGAMRCALVIGAMSAIAAAGLFAQQTISNDPALEAKVHEVASVLRCPVCQGLSLNDSPSELSQQMRQLVREKLAAGESPEEIKAYFVSKYGEWVLLEPKPKGMNLVVYLAPFILLLGGGGLIVVMVRKWSSQAAAPVRTEADIEEEILN